MSQKRQQKQTRYKNCSEDQKPPNQNLLTPQMHEDGSDQRCLDGRDD
jgi:hypothetical protein